MKQLNGSRMRLMIVGFAAAIMLGGGSVRADFVFGEPVNLGPTVNSSYNDWDASLSTDGLELYFSSNRTGGAGALDIWLAKRASKSSDWGEPTNIGAIVNGPRGEIDPAVSADGLWLYFSSNRPGGYGGFDLWVTSRPTRDDDWGPPVNLGPTINSPHDDIDPRLSTDGLVLYFSSDRPGGFGSLDIWKTTRPIKEDPWGTPSNLGGVVNSPAQECNLSISADGLLLFFSEDTAGPFRPGGLGGSDMWVTTRMEKDEPWGIPMNLGPTVNSVYEEDDPSISPDGFWLIFNSPRTDGYGQHDLWASPVIPIIDFNSDGMVDIDDLVIFIEHWGSDESLCDIGPMPWGDGIVDVKDLEVLMSYWGQEIDDPTLIANWKLDEIEGDIAYNSVGDSDGSVHGNPIWQPDGGMVDGAIELDGANDYISVPFVINLEDKKFSIFAWIKGVTPGQTIISQANKANWLSADSSEGRLMSELVAGRGATPLVSDAVIIDGEWHRVGLIWDGFVKILHVDDAEVASDVLTNFSSSEDNMHIGVDKNLTPGSFFSGLIDDVRIYNRAITP